MSFHYMECKKNETHQYQRVGWWSSGAGRWGRWGDVGQMVQILSCKMNASWGGMCSMLTVVNPVLLLHAGNLSGEYVFSVFTTLRTWEFGGDGCVHQWFVINISQCTHVTWSQGIWYVYTHSFGQSVLPHQTCSSGSCVGLRPRNVQRAADDSDLDLALSTRALSLHF